METRNKLEEMGERILSESRTELYLSMRFMGPALNSLGYRMDLRTRTVGTDAAFIRFNPSYLAEIFLNHPYMLNRAYIHMLMHCLFRHMFRAREYPDGELWDLCSDIAAESVVDSMNYPAISRTQSDFREEVYHFFEDEIKVLTAERLYAWFIARKRDYEKEARLRREFTVDDHSFWQHMKDRQKEPDQEPPAQAKTKAPPSGAMADHADPNGEKPDENVTPLGKTSPEEEEWKKNAKRIKSDLETFAKDAAEDSGSLDKVLSFSVKRRRNYRDFLKKFSILREEATVDMDSFDYGFYNYGMEMYGNMPLIEENEFREVRKVDELVIAIDTSASCQDVLVQKFLNETASLLLSQENFFHRTEIHVITCDNQVQDDVRITDVEQMKDYASGFHLRGGYGTDFRPVFSYVKKLQNQGQLSHLRGLIYFTDGFGTYPKQATPYETAFVFWTDEDMNDKDVPDWAQKLYLEDR